MGENNASMAAGEIRQHKHLYVKICFVSLAEEPFCGVL
jgi:hypothetical protein